MADSTSIKKIKLWPEHYTNQKVRIECWVQSNRDSKKIGFLSVRDGSTLETMQIVYKDNLKNFNQITKILTGSAIVIEGEIVKSNNKEIIELQADLVNIINATKPNYFLQKKEHSLEFLREKAELRGRTSLLQAIFSIRHGIIWAIHNFFVKENFLHLQTPILTSNDCEGGGESFFVNDKCDEKNLFFNKNTHLTVSGQLHAEAFAQIYKKVYTFGPTFRAEKSNTTQHGSEFWMLEAECAFANQSESIVLAIDLIKYILQQVYSNYQKELLFLQEKQDANLMSKIETMANSEFLKITYDEAIEIINKQGKNKIQSLQWGEDLSREHELFLSKEQKGKPIFIINYPKKIKAFYMKTNSDQKTTACFDLIFPYVGEVLGGSEREADYNKLINNIKTQNISMKDLEWYINLRKQGYGGSAGFGLGLDRLLMFMTGTKNIRDVIPFYRGFKNIKF